MSTPQKPLAKTVGQLRASGWKNRSVKEELRNNLIDRLRSKSPVFQGIYGYDETVIPELQRAILSLHNINLLGLRGQAKTRIARLMTELLDEWMPILQGSDLNDDPFHPISFEGKKLIETQGEQAPIDWLHRSERYTEKLATPDVSVADLIGDIDPIKAANLKVSYADEKAIHYGLIPRSNRCIFVLNELPDLQARIQVALLNILQEGDIQIRGFKIRLPLDIQFVFTANPEDYTNRGSIITPLKDRIDSQIITHYPADIETGKKITRQEIHKKEAQEHIHVPEPAADLIEQIAVEARHSEFVDPKSGVSARLTISAFENMLSEAERRMLLTNAASTAIRISDVYGCVPAITGKIELVYEGEQEGAFIVANNLIGIAIRTLFARYFPDPEKIKKQKGASPYQPIIDYFSQGNRLNIMTLDSDKEYQNVLDSVPGLDDLIFDAQVPLSLEERYFWKELILFGLSEFSVIGKKALGPSVRFSDLLDSMMEFDADNEEED